MPSPTGVIATSAQASANTKTPSLASPTWRASTANSTSEPSLPTISPAARTAVFLAARSPASWTASPGAGGRSEGSDEPSGGGMGMYSRSRMTVSWEVLDSVEAVEPAVADWDRLAVEKGLPYCAPAFLLAWWNHVAPEGARLRVVAVRDGQGHVAGIGPFYAVRERGLPAWSLLGSDLAAPVEPLGDAEAHQPLRGAPGASRGARRIRGRAPPPRRAARELALAGRAGRRPRLPPPHAADARA